MQLIGSCCWSCVALSPLQCCACALCPMGCYRQCGRPAHSQPGCACRASPLLKLYVPPVQQSQCLIVLQQSSSKHCIAVAAEPAPVINTRRRHALAAFFQMAAAARSRMRCHPRCSAAHRLWRSWTSTRTSSGRCGMRFRILPTTHAACHHQLQPCVV